MLEDTCVLHPLTIQVEGRLTTRAEHRIGSARSLHEGYTVQQVVYRTAIPERGYCRDISDECTILEGEGLSLSPNRHIL